MMKEKIMIRMEKIVFISATSFIDCVRLRLTPTSFDTFNSDYWLTLPAHPEPVDYSLLSCFILLMNL